MRHFMSVVVLILCNVAVFAEDAPKAEIFGGFSYGNYELIAGESPSVIGTTTISGAPSARLGLFGWDGSVVANMNRWFGFATDFSGYYSGSSTSNTLTETLVCGTGCTQTITIVNTASSPKIYNFLFGPQFSYRSGKVRPFGQFLLGGNHTDITRSETASSTGIGFGLPSQSSRVGTSGFAMAFGGGVDYSIKHNLAWRVESDYLTNTGAGQNHVRVSTGLVWRLGS